jgi:hypothetical protein
MSVRFIFSFLITAAAFTQSVMAQVKSPLLEKRISIQISNVKTDAALNQIGAKGNFTFSYNSALIDANRTLNYEFKNRSVREIIQVLFNGKLEGKAKGNHIILTRVKVRQPEEKKPESFRVTGYIESSTGEKIPWASIYSRKTLNSAVSDEYGFYSLTLPTSITDLSLTISRKDFNDTIIQLSDNSTQFRNVVLSRVIKDTIDEEKPFADAERTLSLFLDQTDYANQENIKDTLYTSMQVSFLPFAGTNGRLSGNVINDYSLNVFGGYSLGNRKLELGGFFNINRGNVDGVQLAGFVNGTGGNVSGLQMAGFVNGVKGNVEGAQLAGFVNAIKGDAGKCQLAGFVNAVNGNVKGFQGAGFVNTVRKKMSGVQLAGFVNLSIDSMVGAQIAGFVNTALGKCNAVQVAGFVNTAHDSASGAQVAGFVNYVRRSYRGNQVAGFVNVVHHDIKGSQTSLFNYARNVHGAQVGFLNIANSVTGIPAGIISYVREGYHQLEFSADESFYTNVAFRTGVASFHNILTAGMNPGSDTWIFGYGLGTTMKAGQKWNFDIDLTCSQVVDEGRLEKLHLINRLYAGMEYRISPTVGIAFGPLLNASVTETREFYPQSDNALQPDSFYDTTLDAERLQLKLWTGGKVAIRFF